MSALEPLMLSLGRFLRSHWAGFLRVSETDPRPGTWLRSDRFTCSARTGFRAVTTPLFWSDTVRLVHRRYLSADRKSCTACRLICIHRQHAGIRLMPRCPTIRPANVGSFSTKLCRCVDETPRCMKSNRLQSNHDKTEALWCLMNRRHRQILTTCLLIDGAAVNPVKSVRDPGP